MMTPCAARICCSIPWPRKNFKSCPIIVRSVSQIAEGTRAASVFCESTICGRQNTARSCEEALNVMSMGMAFLNWTTPLNWIYPIMI